MSYLAGVNHAQKPALIIVGLLLVTLAGALVTVTPTWLTVFLSPLILVLLLTKPMVGLFFVMGLLYFPLLPAVSLGPWEGSVTALPLLVLGVHGLVQPRRSAARSLLSRWQAALLVGLGGAFLLSTLGSTSFGQSFRLLPNLAIYLATLLATMTIINTPEKLIRIAKITLILAAFLSVWRIELRPLRTFLGLPSLGINGAVFAFHPAVTLSLLILLTPGTMFSLAWRGFAGITLFSLAAHSLLLQTRGSWLAWAVVLLVLFLYSHGRQRAALGRLLVVFGLVGAVLYADIVVENWSNTLNAITAFVERRPGLVTQSGDELRVQRFEAGWDMFLEKPLLGWGPNQYHSQILSRKIAGDRSTGEGAFNSWLITLVDFGILGTSLTLIVFSLPVLLVGRTIRSHPTNEAVRLAFGFALGALALATHLFFIDLLYSFAWFYAGLALAAAQISMEAVAQKSERLAV